MADIIELILADHMRMRRLLAEIETSLGRPDVLAACAAAADHIDDLESGALDRFRRDAPIPAPDALGRQWMAFVAANVSGDKHRDPF